MITNILEQLGLEEKEIKVYLTSLRLGPSPVRKIALEAGVNRGTCYDFLKILLAKGLVSYYHQDKHKYFVAEDPENLKEIVLTEEERISKVKKELKEVIPELKSIYDNAGDKPVVKYYEGFLGIKIILKDVLNTFVDAGKKEYFVYSAADIRDYLYKAYPHFTRERIQDKIYVKVIAMGSGGRLCGLDERLWLSRQKGSPTYILIYQNKVAMISVDKNQDPLGVIIEDEGIYKTQVILFQKMWELLKLSKKEQHTLCK